MIDFSMLRVHYHVSAPLKVIVLQKIYLYWYKGPTLLNKATTKQKQKNDQQKRKQSNKTVELQIKDMNLPKRGETPNKG